MVGGWLGGGGGGGGGGRKVVSEKRKCRDRGLVKFDAMLDSSGVLHRGREIVTKEEYLANIDKSCGRKVEILG